jgi:hypothetical protein
LDRGEQIDREEFIRTHAEFDRQLRNYFASVDHVSAWAEDSSPAAPCAVSVLSNGAGSGQPPVESGLGGDIPPRTLLDEYEILEKLGEGGMGTVHKARHRRLDRVVALKVLSKERTADSRAVARFEREMRAVGWLDHPNIVRAMDAREAAGVRFLVMEYVVGMDLGEVARLCGPLSIANVCEVKRQAALGLQYAHENGLIRRDVKPSNMIPSVGRTRSRGPSGRSEDETMVRQADRSTQGPSAKQRPLEAAEPLVVKILDLGLALLDDGGVFGTDATSSRGGGAWTQRPSSGATRTAWSSRSTPGPTRPSSTRATRSSAWPTGLPATVVAAPTARCPSGRPIPWIATGGSPAACWSVTTRVGCTVARRSAVVTSHRRLEQWMEFVKNQMQLGGPGAAAPKLVCIDLQPGTSTQAQESDDILNVGGFSDAVFNVVASFLVGDRVGDPH